MRRAQGRRAVTGVVIGVAVAAMLAACSSGADPAQSPADRPPSADQDAAPRTDADQPTDGGTSSPDEGRDAPGDADDGAATPPGRGRTVWLCHPDLARNPCVDDLAVRTVVDGRRSQPRPLRAASDPAFDCFYVYPTVSRSPRRTAPRRVTPELQFVARAQVAWFSQVCDVYAPVYRQITLAGLGAGAFFDAVSTEVGYGDVLAAWESYLAQAPPDRPFLLVGHSQGATRLVRLVRERIEADAVVRDRLLSAMLLGGAVTVPEGADVGGSFRFVPVCRAVDQTGCVVAWNTFRGQPPNPSLFGRAGPGQQIVCVSPVDPAAGLDGGAARPLEPVIPQPPAVTDTQVRGLTSLPGALVGRCRSGDGATWFEVAPADGGAFPPDVLARAETGPLWGLHRGDVTVALGDLVRMAQAQAAAWRP
jgi:hypothetical protein